MRAAIKKGKGIEAERATLAWRIVELEKGHKETLQAHQTDVQSLQEAGARLAVHADEHHAAQKQLAISQVLPHQYVRLCAQALLPIHSTYLVHSLAQ